MFQQIKRQVVEVAIVCINATIATKLELGTHIASSLQLRQEEPLKRCDDDVHDRSGTMMPMYEVTFKDAKLGVELCENKDSKELPVVFSPAADKSLPKAGHVLVAINGKNLATGSPTTFDDAIGAIADAGRPLILTFLSTNAKVTLKEEQVDALVIKELKFVPEKKRNLSIEEQIAKLREHVPDDKTDNELLAVIRAANGDDVSSTGARQCNDDQRVYNGNITLLRPPCPPPPYRPSSRGRLPSGGRPLLALRKRVRVQRRWKNGVHMGTVFLATGPLLLGVQRPLAGSAGDTAVRRARIETEVYHVHAPAFPRRGSFSS